MAVKTVVLLAIKPKWAEKIYAGEKTVEIRRTMIHRWGSPVLLYESHPVMMVTGMMRFTERREVHTSDPLILADACLTRQEMDEYAGNRVVYSYRIADVKRFDMVWLSLLGSVLVVRKHEHLAVTMFDDLDRSIAMDISKREAGAIADYLLETVPFSERRPENVLDLIENDAEGEIRRIFKERMGTENGWSDALSDVLTVIRDMFTDLTDNGGEQ